MKNRVLIALLVISALFASCANSKESAPKYHQATGYFVRNTVADGMMTERITSRERMEQLFGMATTMTSQPTEIDFRKEFAAAILLPATNLSTSITIDSVKYADMQTAVYYSVKQGHAESYSTRPVAIIVMDKKYDDDVVFVCEGQKREPGYIMLDIVDGRAQATASKQASQTVVFAFESGAYSKLSGQLSSPDSLANIRFIQIFMPDGSADGPFGWEMSYELDHKGLYRLSVGENMMAGDPWAGEFSVAIELE